MTNRPWLDAGACSYAPPIRSADRSTCGALWGLLRSIDCSACGALWALLRSIDRCACGALWMELKSEYLRSFLQNDFLNRSAVDLATGVQRKSRQEGHITRPHISRKYLWHLLFD